MRRGGFVTCPSASVGESFGDARISGHSARGVLGLSELLWRFRLFHRRLGNLDERERKGFRRIDWPAA